MTTIVYGIPSCDKVKKVCAYLTEHGIVYIFHDYKKQGVPKAELRAWVKANGWEALLNRRGTTWRGLDETVRAAVIDDESAIAVMLTNASTIKRPVVVADQMIIIGADVEALSKISR